MQISERTPVTLLTPVLGSPGPADSSIGGPLLWPADESWRGASCRTTGTNPV